MSITPVSTFESDELAPSVVWFSRLDGRYLVEVVRDEEDGNSGFLRVFDHENDDKLLLNNRTGLSYGAAFGPDVADVAAWQEAVIRAIDGQ